VEILEIKYRVYKQCYKTHVYSGYSIRHRQHSFGCDYYMVEFKVQNIVASTTFADKLDLDLIAQSLEEVEYEPEQFPGLVYRIKNPKTATLLFRSGAANCTGAKNIEDVRKAIDIIAEKLRELGMSIHKNLEIVVQNMVATADLGGDLNLNEVAVGLGLENVEYEPEQFPGLVYRLIDPKVALLLFGSGKIVCAGARKIEDVSLAVDKVSKELSLLGLLHR
jgi:transcription initiation factor TFIID TATA-box-binding protein